LRRRGQGFSPEFPQGRARESGLALFVCVGLPTHPVTTLKGIRRREFRRVTYVTMAGCRSCWWWVVGFSYRQSAELVKGARMRTLAELAQIVKSECAYKNWYVYAEPYISAMESLTSISDNYYEDSGSSIVLYALSNLTYWRGDTARTVKAELNAHLKGVRA